MTSTEIALLLNSNSEKITRIGEIIGKKIEEKDNFENLNEFEKTFILIDVFEHSVTNGGFVQLFFNSSGQFAHEILQAYIAIEATKTVEIISKAIQLFPVIPVPKNLRIRQQALMTSSENLDLWDSLDIEFDKYEDDIIQLTIDYVRKNIHYFD
tara:strand:+ start:67 stop:528 length:462 start_codon:yes stop_codon:yes gene_type:complete